MDINRRDRLNIRGSVFKFCSSFSLLVLETSLGWCFGLVNLEDKRMAPDLLAMKYKIKVLAVIRSGLGS